MPVSRAVPWRDRLLYGARGTERQRREHPLPPELLEVSGRAGHEAARVVERAGEGGAVLEARGGESGERPIDHRDEPGGRVRPALAHLGVLARLDLAYETQEVRAREGGPPREALV